MMIYTFGLYTIIMFEMAGDQVTFENQISAPSTPHVIVQTKYL